MESLLLSFCSVFFSLPSPTFPFHFPLSSLHLPLDIWVCLSRSLFQITRDHRLLGKQGLAMMSRTQLGLRLKGCSFRHLVRGSPASAADSQHGGCSSAPGALGTPKAPGQQRCPCSQGWQCEPAPGLPPPPRSSLPTPVTLDVAGWPQVWLGLHLPLLADCWHLAAPPSASALRPEVGTCPPWLHEASARGRGPG